MTPKRPNNFWRDLVLRALMHMGDVADVRDIVEWVGCRADLTERERGTTRPGNRPRYAQTVRSVARAGEWNHLRVVAEGNSGEVFVNSQSLGTFRLGGVTHAGDIAVTTANDAGDEIDGSVTKVTDIVAIDLGGGA